MGRGEPCSASPDNDADTGTAGALLVATGDVILQEKLWRQTEDAAETNGFPSIHPQLANTAPIMSATHLAICHLEVPLAPPYRPYPAHRSSCPH
jgi:Bacterial capsule synthesis protein PGA_cap